MANERDIQFANQLLRDFRGRIGDRKSRQHESTIDANMHKQRALDGICGHCVNLFIEVQGSGPSANVSLRCRKFHSPLHMYEDTPLGQVPECEDFTPITEAETGKGGD